MYQLSLFDLIPDSNYKPSSTVNVPKINKLRKLADNLQRKIDDKLNPAIASQRVTRRRANIVASMRQDGLKLQGIQGYLYAIADDLEEGILPNILSNISTIAQVEVLWSFGNEKWNQKNLENVFSDDWYIDYRRRLIQANITNINQLNSAIAALKELSPSVKEDPIAVQIRQLEHSLIGYDIPGYFPTPDNICKQMVQLACLEPQMKVWEPGAGNGQIVETIKESVDVDLTVSEINPTLRQILTLKGFNVIAADCFTVKEKFNRILMNPPFSGEEIKHIYHAYSCLKDDGRLISIVPESITFRKNKIYQEFREWLDDKCVFNEALPKGSFLNSSRSTGVSTRILVIQK
ncbi:DNA methyltransferase [Gloeothece verrucosa]|uniref:DNA-methyltransferase n=1 Tax=Gloeothece verrucosa (strain PCC 7822) TaxID=497965 RepID=E0UNN7_GLOV7|nr:DNA methyltransferase [Gloeothece verrucosa]ADN18567.1 DNA-methyltransferase [Gloeothece verrucosa PCC 7822]